MTYKKQPGIITTLLVGEPGVMRDSLCTLLNAIPTVQIKKVVHMEESLDLQDDQTTNCIIVDCSNGNPEPLFLEWITKMKKEHPLCGCLVISASSKHNRLYQSAGADIILVSGFSHQELQLSLQELFEVKGDINCSQTHIL